MKRGDKAKAVLTNLQDKDEKTIDQSDSFCTVPVAVFDCSFKHDQNEALRHIEVSSLDYSANNYLGYFPHALRALPSSLLREGHVSLEFDRI